MRANGCENPNGCRDFARTLMGRLGDKWRLGHDKGNRCITAKERMLSDETGGLLFNPDIELKGSFKDGFRVFVPDKGQVMIDHVDYSRRSQGPIQLTTVYTDGSCIGNGTVQAVAGAGLWYGNEDQRNEAIRLPAHLMQTNNTGEALAILRAMQTTPSENALKVISDSQIMIDSMTTYLEKNENDGWIGAANQILMRSLAAHLGSRKGITLFEKVKGHSGVEGNEGADKLAEAGTAKANPDTIDLAIPPNYDLPGAKLATIRQATLYRGMIEMRQMPYRRSTATNLDMTRWAISEHNGEAPMDDRIWKSLKDRSIPKETRAFLWKAMHGAFKIGKYWENIENYEHRAVCPACDQATESMEHILTECNT